jgi:hypothetical protein
MSIRSFARVGACICAAALTLAACGSSDKKSSTTTDKTEISDPATYTATTVKLATDDACAIFTQAEVNALLGGPATNKPDSSPSPNEKACLWEANVDGVNYLLQARVGGEQFYTGNIPGNEPLDGIGDKAAIREAGNGSEETISTLKDGLSVTVALSAHEIGKTQLAKAKRDQLISLVKSAANK